VGMLHGVLVLCRQTGGLFYSKVGSTCFPRGNETPVGAAAGVISRHSQKKFMQGFRVHALWAWVTSSIEKNKRAEEAAVAELLFADKDFVFRPVQTCGPSALAHNLKPFPRRIPRTLACLRRAPRIRTTSPPSSLPSSSTPLQSLANQTMLLSTEIRCMARPTRPRSSRWKCTGCW
jgi:hypothetical protein